MEDNKTIQDLKYNEANQVFYELILPLAEQVAYKINVTDDGFWAKAKVSVFEI